MRSFLLLAIPSLISAQELAFRRLPAAGAAPTGRVDGVIAYDERQRQILLFGGRDNSPRNDLWSYSLDRGEWTERRPSGTPPAPRFGHTVLLDAQRRRLVVFGGQASGFFSDTWAYDLERNQWSQLAADNAGPSRRYGHSAILDAARDRMIVSHGFTNSGRFDDTWSFDLRTNRWQDISPSSGRPLRRCLHHAVLDAAGNQMLLYGGCASGFGPCPLGDLWSFDLAAHRWTERTAAVKPPGRQWHGLGFDSDRRRLILFGGSGDTGALNDTWEYDPAQNQWMQIRSLDTPAGRDRHETTFMPNLGIVFFGGQISFNPANELLLLGPPPFGPRLSGLVNDFNGAAGPIAPGQIVALNGTALGPETTAYNTLADGVLPRAAADVTVTFNGIEAPVLSAQATRVVVQAPYEIEGLAETEIVVRVAGRASEPLHATVTTTSPGLDPSVFRLDGSTTSVDNPASPGDVIVLLATGLGAMVPAVPTGVAPRSDSPIRPVAPIRVLIGEHESELLYIGSAADRPGAVQISIRIPQAAAGATTITLQAGESATTTPAFIRE
jgi:uncharacterized protein (TIGR03437 family)